jgi:hypothetical protein
MGKNKIKKSFNKKGKKGKKGQKGKKRQNNSSVGGSQEFENTQHPPEEVTDIPIEEAKSEDSDGESSDKELLEQQQPNASKLNKGVIGKSQIEESKGEAESSDEDDSKKMECGPKISKGSQLDLKDETSQSEPDGLTKPQDKGENTSQNLEKDQVPSKEEAKIKQDEEKPEEVSHSIHSAESQIDPSDVS